MRFGSALFGDRLFFVFDIGVPVAIPTIIATATYIHLRRTASSRSRLVYGWFVGAVAVNAIVFFGWMLIGLMMVEC